MTLDLSSIMTLEGCTVKILISIVSGVGAFVIFRRIMRAVPGVCSNENSLEGKTVIVTGANTGIGKEIAKDLAKRKARVILACRDIKKGKETAREIEKQAGAGAGDNLVVKKLDLASFKSIREFSQDIESSEPKLDILINNAGVFGPPYSLTEEGYETTFAVNHLGHFLLTNLLLKKLENSAPARIIIVASKLYERAKMNFENLNGEMSYNGINAYKQSKLANMLFCFELSKRLPNGVTVNSLHPGLVATELPRYMLNNAFKRAVYPLLAFLFARSPKEGAQTIIHLATASEVEGVSGRYFGDCREEEVKPHALDEEASLQLWQMSAKMCRLS